MLSYVRMMMVAALAFVLVSLGGTAHAQNLTGVWRGMMATPWGQQMGTEAIFFPNGTYTVAAQMGTLMARHWGTYQFGGSWIHFNLQGWQPQRYCAHLGCVTLAWPNSETWQLTYFDGKVLRTSNGMLQRVQ